MKLTTIANLTTHLFRFKKKKKDLHASAALGEKKYHHSKHSNVACEGATANLWSTLWFNLNINYSHANLLLITCNDS